MGLHHVNDTILFLAGERVIPRSSDQESMPDIELSRLPFRLDIDPEITELETILKLFVMKSGKGLLHSEKKTQGRRFMAGYVMHSFICRFHTCFS